MKRLPANRMMSQRRPLPVWRMSTRVGSRAKANSTRERKAKRKEAAMFSLRRISSLKSLRKMSPTARRNLMAGPPPP